MYKYCNHLHAFLNPHFVKPFTILKLCRKTSGSRRMSRSTAKRPKRSKKTKKHSDTEEQMDIEDTYKENLSKKVSTRRNAAASKHRNSSELSTSLTSEIDVECVSHESLFEDSNSSDNRDSLDDSVDGQTGEKPAKAKLRKSDQEPGANSRSKIATSPKKKQSKERKTSEKSSKPELSEKRGSVSGPSHGNKYFGVIFVSCASLALIAAVLIMPYVGGLTKNEKTANKAPELEKKFNNNFRQLKKAHPGLSQRFWKISYVSIHSVVQNPVPTQPAVVMIVNQPGQYDQGLNLASQLSRLYPAKNGPVIINSSDYRSADPDDAKLKIDKLLVDGFESGSKAAVITRLEELPPPSVLIFYKYCDNENAPYKDAVIIFTINLPDRISEDLNPQEQEELVQEFLRSKWEGNQNLDIDKTAALFSRIANSVAFVDTEYDPKPQI